MFIFKVICGKVFGATKKTAKNIDAIRAEEESIKDHITIMTSLTTSFGGGIYDLYPSAVSLVELGRRRKSLQRRYQLQRFLLKLIH